MLNNKNGFPIEQMESAVNTLPLQMPFRLEPRNGNSMRKKKGKRETNSGPALTATATWSPAPQMVDLEKDTRRWWLSPRL